MRDALMDALRAAPSLERIADAIEAGVKAGYVNDERHGIAAAIGVLAAPEPAPETAPEPTAVDAPESPATSDESPAT